MQSVWSLQASTKAPNGLRIEITIAFCISNDEKEMVCRIRSENQSNAKKKYIFALENEQSKWRERKRGRSIFGRLKFMFMDMFYVSFSLFLHRCVLISFRSPFAIHQHNRNDKQKQHIKSIHKTRMRLRQLAVIHLQIHNRDYVYDKHSNTYESRVDRMEHISTPCRTGYLLLSAPANPCSCDVCCM